jgi:hypothetical protein
VKKLPLNGLAPLSMTTEEEVVENILQDPLAIASAGIAFTQASEQNLKNVLQELEEANERIRMVEKDFRFYKGEQTSIQDFRKCVESVRHKIHNLAKEMNTGLQVF